MCVNRRHTFTIRNTKTKAFFKFNKFIYCLYKMYSYWMRHGRTWPFFSFWESLALFNSGIPRKDREVYVYLPYNSPFPRFYKC